MNDGKVVDLRREVKERLSKRGIIDITQLKLKPIDLNSSLNKLNTAFGRAMIKIGDMVIADTLEKDIPNDEKFREIENRVNAEDIKIRVNETDDELANRLLLSFTKNEIKDGNVCVSINFNNDKKNVFSNLYYEPKKKHEGVFYFRDNKSKFISFASFKRIIGTIYFYNHLRKYIETNFEMANIIRLKYINFKGIYLDEKHKNDIINELETNGFSAVKDKKTRFILDNNYSIEGIKKYFSYYLWKDKYDYFNKINDLFFCKDNTNLCSPSSISHIELSIAYFNFLCDLNNEEKDIVDEERKISTDYAKSYETKKNIPLKIQKEMEKSKFLSRFGYVEYDELVDLDKIKIIEKEWEDLNKKVIIPLAKDHSLRFRRLGKQRAGGLYYYHKKAVCIDIKSPSSFIHEVMHMIDYTTIEGTTLSSMFKFRPIIERYRIITDEKVDKLDVDHPLRKSWYSKNKYNRKYYHNRHEIFARCGELYIAKVLNIDNSLVNINDPVLYPSDDENLMKLINNYYSSIIETHKENLDIEEVASNLTNTNMGGKVELKNIEKILETKQINLFDMVDGLIK